MPTLVAGFHRPLVRYRRPDKLVNLLYSLDLRPDNSHLDSQIAPWALSSKLSVFYDPVVLAARGGTPVGRVASATRSPARSSDAGNAGHWTGAATKLEPGAAATPATSAARL